MGKYTSKMFMQTKKVTFSPRQKCHLLEKCRRFELPCCQLCNKEEVEKYGLAGNCDFSLFYARRVSRGNIIKLIHIFRRAY